MRRVSIFVPVLLSILPILFVYAHNAAQLLPLQLIQPLLVASVVAVLLSVLSFLWLRNRLVSGILAGAVCFLFQSFGVVQRGLHAAGLAVVLGNWLAAGALLTVVVLVAVAARRAACRPGAWQALHQRLLTVAILLLILQVGRIVVVEWRAQQATLAHHPAAPASERVAVEGLPDIYFILLDGYGRQDVLMDLYGFDNGDFIEALQNLGFHVAKDSRANYVGTLWALASILNMNYIQELVQVDVDLQQLNPLIRLVRNNRVVHELRGLGYEVITLSSGYGVAEFGKPDVYLEPPASRDDFEQLLLDATALSLWWSHSSDVHGMHRQRLHWAFETLADVPESERPRFVFAHILAPHPPFVVDADGKPMQATTGFALNDGSDYYRLGHSQEEYVQGYAGQVRWVTAQVRASVEQILAQSQRPTVIALMSDHGPGSGLDWESAEKSNLQERFGILLALRLPDAAGLQLSQELSPVSTFRLIFDLYLGGRMGPLPVRNYFCPKSRPFAFEDITETLTTSP